MLGHDSHCDFILQEKMIGTQAAAREFLLDIHTRLAPLAKEELAALVALKQKDESAAAADKGVIHGWDTAYYSRILKEDTLGLIRFDGKRRLDVVVNDEQRQAYRLVSRYWTADSALFIREDLAVDG